MFPVDNVLFKILRLLGKATSTTTKRTKFYTVDQTQNDFPVYDCMVRNANVRI